MKRFKLFEEFDTATNDVETERDFSFGKEDFLRILKTKKEVKLTDFPSLYYAMKEIILDQEERIKNLEENIQ